MGRQATTHITASGNISSSGNITANYYDAKQSSAGYKLSGAKVVYVDSSTYVFGRDATTKITGSTISLGSPGDAAHITASGNISSSGTIYSATSRASTFRGIENPLQIGANNGSSEITIKGNITASGNISSSGYIQASELKGDSSLGGVGGLLVTGYISASDSVTATVYKFPNDSVRLAESAAGNAVFYGGGLEVTSGTGNITASGNISASNIIGTNLIADSASFSTRVTLNDAKVTNSHQDISALALKTQISGSFFAPSASFSTRVTLNDAKVTNSHQSLVHLAVTSSNVLFGAITASSNISSSGTITANAFAGHVIHINSATGFLNVNSQSMDNTKVHLGSSNYGHTDARDYGVAGGTVTIKSQGRFQNAAAKMRMCLFTSSRQEGGTPASITLTKILEVETASSNTWGMFQNMDGSATVDIDAGSIIYVGFGRTEGTTAQKPRINYTLTGITR